MKFVVEVDDFYLSEDDNLEEGLKKHITDNVISQISKQIKEKVDKQVVMEVHDIVEKNLYRDISSAIKSTVEKAEMPSRKDRNKSVTIEEYVRECIEEHTNYNSFTDIIKRVANDFAKQMKDRIDMQFASQLVIKMSENGLLKDDVANLLLKSSATGK